MNREQLHPSGYVSTEAERSKAHQELIFAASLLMRGQLDNPPFWHEPNQDHVPYREQDYRRLRYLALTQYDDDKGFTFIAAELRILEDGKDYPSAFYSLSFGEIEIVWHEQVSDVLLCEKENQTIIDGLDAPEVFDLAECLGPDMCKIYDPATHQINDDGELVPNETIVA